MAEVLLFHHAQGLTEGVRRFADGLSRAGHTVHTPDLYDGATFETIEDGVGHARELGFGNVRESGVAAADGLPAGLVYAGFSLGAMPAQQLAQTRPGALGALLLEAFVPPEEFGAWPEGVPVQVHGMADDEFFSEDRPAAEAFVADRPEAELFLYPGKQHLFADDSLAGYDKVAADLLTERVLAFLAALS
ncbi:MULTISPECIES: dienelactone hydrolase family protein [unclassified Nocardioides]|uniref:dienelactone hydrolase family protein n=1 Tax=unclassified Nocardioides TaxID=2615069 RepID=UPI00361027E2